MLTIAKGLQLLRDRKLELSPQNVVIVDEAAMVGTDDLRQLLSATTAAGTKTILVGDAHQLTPVKARGGCSPNYAPISRDTTPFRGVAHARPRRTQRVAGPA